MIRRQHRIPIIARTLLLCAATALAPISTHAWGANAERLIATRAIETLPPEVRAFFDTNRESILRHVTDPLTALENNPTTEGPNHVLYLDRYGKFPFAALPRDYRAALAKFGRPKLLSGGLLPWQIGLVSQRLTDAFRAGNWEQARILAATLAGYVAQTHDPFNTTEDFDGHSTNQLGINTRFSANLVERYSLFFPMHPNDAAYIYDPTDHAFESCLNAHSWLESIFLADRRSRAGLTDYTDDYYDRFYTQAGSTLIRQLSEAATDIGSYWLTCWINAWPPRTSPPIKMSGPQSSASSLASRIATLPKAELHLHLEGAIEPVTVVELAARYSDIIAPGQVTARYATTDFPAFIEAYKWVTSYLRTPDDYALVAREAAERLLTQNVVYAEITLSAGVMLLRKQDPAANLRAIREAVEPYESLGLRLQWIFDCVRQFGPRPAMDVARIAAELRGEGVVAFGIGGNELSLPASDFREAFDFAATNNLRRVAHAGEIGGPDSVRDAINIFGAERIGHGIAATRDPALAALLRERSIPLEICPISNLRTGALARQIGQDHAELRHHPLPDLLRSGVTLSVSTDDPAMFNTDLQREYLATIEMGLSPRELARVAAAAFQGAFLPTPEKFAYLNKFTRQAALVDLV